MGCSRKILGKFWKKSRGMSKEILDEVLGEISEKMTEGIFEGLSLKILEEFL